ncbi:hypothetical protein CPAR01_10160 [Colletotrichum paranaense]|uniref:Uncharacterized protein n=2 Tax=Colletotrichum acutatum species complex TaxID=2707335 RepID=A0ABQ9SD76_9PEZI|nr:uncharacterized protein CPAR01_10160 [Colletotrichum paranaense]XP_060379732.1 uncharacterized protein CTAM01_09645 [Colletotrichum tamarilloi]KAK1493018.1 hypothetical protein CTAM01_09645 [Colletotrichum tamarilloi]KAK1533452.1 hypothetical protein CPAR01_10160 [Colletotrichum paranaense]
MGSLPPSPPLPLPPWWSLTGVPVSSAAAISQCCDRRLFRPVSSLEVNVPSEEWLIANYTFMFTSACVGEAIPNTCESVRKHNSGSQKISDMLVMGR